MLLIGIFESIRRIYLFIFVNDRIIVEKRIKFTEKRMKYLEEKRYLKLLKLYISRVYLLERRRFFRSNRNTRTTELPTI